MNRERPYKLWIELKRWDDKLTGSLVAFSQNEFPTGPLSHWVALQRVGDSYPLKIEWTASILLALGPLSPTLVGRGPPRYWSRGSSLLSNEGHKMNDSSPVVIVTGGSKGIGLAISVAFGSQGWRVAIVARNQDALHTAVAAVEAR